MTGMVFELQTIDALIISFLTFSMGYIILTFSFKRARRMDKFFTANSFDKSMLSLIFGTFVFLLSSISLNISLVSIESIITNFYFIVLIESVYSFLLVIIISDYIRS